MSGTNRMEPGGAVAREWTERLGEVMGDETLSARERLLMVEALFAHDSAGPALAPPAGPGGPAAPEPSRTVLVVDDEPAIREMLWRQLDRAGYVVLEAENGGEALRLIEQPGAGIELVLSDIAMPGMNGFELAARVLAGHPEKRVVLMSANPPGGFAPVAAGLAIVRLIRKPCEPGDLLEALRAALTADPIPRRADGTPGSWTRRVPATTPP